VYHAVVDRNITTPADYDAWRELLTDESWVLIGAGIERLATAEGTACRIPVYRTKRPVVLP
jgi:hypothetical protein